jgi:heme/copper-type cytochrome/quinol oxidase subunit 2
MHKRYISLAAIAGGLVLLGAGCFGGDNSGQNNTYTPPPSTSGLPTTTNPTSTPTGTTQNPPPTTNTTSTTASKRRVFNMTAKQFAFSPSTITVNKGDTVEIHLTSQDVSHGFSISEYNINVTTSEGNPQVITFVANQAGTFTYRCSVPCGPGHLNMKGTLIVK